MHLSSCEQSCQDALLSLSPQNRSAVQTGFSLRARTTSVLFSDGSLGPLTVLGTQQVLNTHLQTERIALRNYFSKDGAYVTTQGS